MLFPTWDIAPFFVRYMAFEPTFQNAFPREALFRGVSTRFGLIVEKVLRKDILKGWFGLPKFSFGEHDIANVLQKDSISRTNASYGTACAQNPKSLIPDPPIQASDDQRASQPC